MIMFINILQQSRTLSSPHRDLHPKHNVWSSVVLGLGLQHVLVLSSLSIIAAIIRLAIIIMFSLETCDQGLRKLHIVGKIISEQFQLRVLVLVNSGTQVKSIF